MNFSLLYRGCLRSNGRPEEKHALRRHFHPQLRQLSVHEPLRSVLEDLGAQGEIGRIARSVGPFRFQPIVCSALHVAARLDVTLLRPEAPGSLIVAGGDIDNRLKTLLDSLKVPEPNALPRGSVPQPDEDPFFCLLEDDALVTELTVRTKQLLEPGVAASEVVALVEVTTVRTGTFLDGLELS